MRIPRKNIRDFYGRPIIAYSIETAIAAKLFDRIVVSTDDEEIAEVARRYGAEALQRPDGYADAGTQDVAGVVIEQLSDEKSIPRHACVIYATCPMLNAGDLQAGWQAMNDRYPTFAFAVGAEPLRDAGMFYWGDGWAFRAGVPLIGPRSAMVRIPEARVCDINLESDWLRAERMYADMKQDAACKAC